MKQRLYSTTIYKHSHLFAVSVIQGKLALYIVL